jgi:calcineurin-like phosphoesterase family protein
MPASKNNFHFKHKQVIRYAGNKNMIEVEDAMQKLIQSNIKEK